MSRLQFVSLMLVTLVATKSLSVGAQYSGNSGYQYNRPGFGSDFGDRAGGRPAPVYGPPSGSYGAPGAGGGPGSFNQGGQGGGRGFQGDGFQDGNGNGRSRPYSFQYEVKDAATNNDYGQKESGDEFGSVQGEYRVLLPDTRMQIVRYTADDANGYVADIQYEGEAQFPRPGQAGGGFGGGPGGFPQGRGGGGGGGFGNGGSGGYSSGGPGDGFGSNQYLPPSSSYGK